MKHHLVILATVAGAATAVGVVSSLPADPSAAAVAGPTTAPLRPAGPPLRQDPSPVVGSRLVLGKGTRPAIPGTVRVAAAKPDPAGGPPWVVRTWQRRGVSGGRVWCSQLGREVDGRFVWVVPGESFAGPVPAREGETTVCAVTAPISDRLGVMVGSMPDRDPRDPEARIATTVLWGVVDKPVAAAHIDHAGRRHPLTVERHAVLVVLPGTAPATRPTLVVRDLGGRRREAIPPAFFDVSPRGVVRHTSSPGMADPAELRPLLRVTVGSDNVPNGVFTRPAAPGRRACFAGPTTMVAGRAAVLLDRRSGLVRQAPISCNPLPPGAAREPSAMGGGWTTGDPETPGTSRAREAARRRVEWRTPYGSGGTLVATPTRTRLLEVRSPVGVKTVRVGLERVAWLGWDGQPEVQRAMFPPFPGTRRWEQEIKTGHTPVSLRALDARGRQIGPTAYLGRVVYTREIIRQGRREAAQMRAQMRDFRRREAARRARRD